ncbi:MAG: hypothetical protein JNL83_30055 [Myxococcales bacterium]|nr:hypothetical protein [Myxococcales bacterium]
MTDRAAAGAGEPRALPRSIAQAFRLAAGELGHCSAAWLFVNETERGGGREALAVLRDELGRTYPVLDAVIASRLEGATGPPVAETLDEVVALCEGASHVVIVGIEARFMDALVPRLSARVHLLTQSVLSPDWDRVASNYPGRLDLIGLQDFQRYAGSRSVLVTYAYGTSPSSTYVVPAWLRAAGNHGRTQFRALIGWGALARPFGVYPRWLVETSHDSFTHLVTA